jgi:hypothetical protein
MEMGENLNKAAFTENSEPRLIRSASFEQKIKMIRRLFIQLFGEIESVLEVGGCVVGNTIFCIDCLIPKAVVGYAHFKVEDKDLSECWSEAEDYLNPVADLHFHPGNFKPTASTVDEQNSLRQAGLYHVFNIATSQELRKMSQNPASPSTSCFSYDIDGERRIKIHLEKKIGFTPDIFYEEKIKKALWGSLIYPGNANSENATGNVVEHRYVSNDEVQVSRYEDIETIIISDEKVSKLTGWPLEKINLQYDEDLLEVEVALKYQPYSYCWETSNSTDQPYGYSWEYTRYPVVSYDRPYGNYPVVVNLPGIKKKKKGSRFFCLSENSNLHDVSDLLKEIVALIEDKDRQQFYYFENGASSREIIEALKECARVIKRNQKLHQGIFAGRNDEQK